MQEQIAKAYNEKNLDKLSEIEDTIKANIWAIKTNTFQSVANLSSSEERNIQKMLLSQVKRLKMDVINNKKT